MPVRTAGALKRTVRMYGRSHAESREIVEQKAKGRVRLSQLQCWFRRFREGPRLCPDSVNAPPPNNSTTKLIRPRDQLLHQQVISARRASRQPSAPASLRAPGDVNKRYISQRASRADHRCRQAPHQKRFAIISEYMSLAMSGPSPDLYPY